MDESGRLDGTSERAGESHSETSLVREDSVMLAAAVGLAILAAVGMQRSFSYVDCTTEYTQYGDWVYGLSRVSMILGTGAIVLLIFIAPWLTKRWANLGDDAVRAAPQASAHQATSGRRDATRLLLAAALLVGVAVVANLFAAGEAWYVAPHLAAGAAGVLAAAVAIVLLSVRGSTRGASSITWAILALPLVLLVWNAGGRAWFGELHDPNCGPVYYTATFIGAWLFQMIVPFIAAPVSVGLLLFAERRMRASRS